MIADEEAIIGNNEPVQGMEREFQVLGIPFADDERRNHWLFARRWCRHPRAEQPRRRRQRHASKEFPPIPANLVPHEQLLEPIRFLCPFYQTGHDGLVILNTRFDSQHLPLDAGGRSFFD